jgi:hypothetical protein
MWAETLHTLVKITLSQFYFHNPLQVFTASVIQAEMEPDFRQQIKHMLLIHMHIEEAI